MINELLLMLSLFCIICSVVLAYQTLSGRYDDFENMVLISGGFVFGFAGLLSILGGV